MLKLLVLLSVVCAVQAGHGATCSTTQYSWWFGSFYTESFYCEHGCCGEEGYQDCCDDHDDHGDPHHDYHDDSKHDHDDHHHRGRWSVAGIVGVSLGGLVALLCVILFIMCTVKMCQAGNKKIVSTQPRPMDMHIWSSSGTPAATNIVSLPPAYTPGVQYPLQHAPVYHSPPGYVNPSGPAGYDFNNEKHSYL